jgi:hypothetical protein
MSQSLVNTYFVQFHSSSKDDPNTLKAFTFMVTHDNGDGSLDGAIWCADQDNDAGLSVGWNERSSIGRGGPGQNVSWSPFEEEE